MSTYLQLYCRAVHLDSFEQRSGSSRRKDKTQKSDYLWGSPMVEPKPNNWNYFSVRDLALLFVYHRCAGMMNELMPRRRDDGQFLSPRL